MKVKRLLLVFVGLFFFPLMASADEIDDMVKNTRAKFNNCTDPFNPTTQNIQLKAFCAQAWELGCLNKFDEVNIVCQTMEMMGGSCEGCGKGPKKVAAKPQPTEDDYYRMPELTLERVRANIRKACNTNSGPMVRHYIGEAYSWMRDKGYTSEKANNMLDNIVAEFGHCKEFYGSNKR